VTIRRPSIRHVRTPSVAGLPGPVWPPTKLPGCVAWYDMLQTYTDGGGTVTAIRNMVTGSDAMAEATNPPALDLTGINGRPCMAPDGSNDLLISTEAAVLAAFNGAQLPVTLTAVLQPIDPAVASMVVFSAANSGVANRTWMFFRNVNNIYQVQIIDDAGVSGPARGPAVAVPLLPRVVSLVVGDTYVHGMANNGPYVDNRGGQGNTLLPAGAITVDRVGLFARVDSAPDGFSSIKLGCLIIHSVALARASLRGLHSALMGRWGIST
jgi:hypothetical protein